jgi:uncharacterized protein YjiK
MKKNLSVLLGTLCLGFLAEKSHAQITLVKDYEHKTPTTIGTYQGITYKEGGFSAMYPIAGTDGKEFWVCSDRGVNIDCVNANPAACRPTYDKLFAFPNYTPKIHRIRIQGDSIQILRTITIKRPDKTGATGVINPTGFGSTALEVASTDTVLNCANFAAKTAPKDIWGIDAEGIVVDKDGYFYISEENGPTIWKLDQNGVVIKRYTPYSNLVGAQNLDVQIDTCFKYRKNNRGFESVAITPNGKIYALIQSPLLYPNTTIGENTRVHRLLEIDPVTNQQRMFVYLNDGIIGTGGNQIRLRDWKIGELSAINDTTFLVAEAALRGTTDVRKIYKINISNATPVNSGLYGGQTLEALADVPALAFQGITPVQKTLFLDLNANGWPASLEKAEGIAIIDDSTVVVCNDNDYGQVSPLQDGIATATGITSHILKFSLKGTNKLTNFQFPTSNYRIDGVTGMNSSQAPYVRPTIAGGRFTSILTAGDGPGSYKMVGIPDGLGAFDNNDGTFTLVMNHEFGNTSGATHATGSKGAFVSKWIINKSDLSAVSGSDLANTIKLWDAVNGTYQTYTSSFPSTLTAFGRFCSADLAEVSAYYNEGTGLGTQERIFMNGEETGNEGRGMAHIITGPEAGVSYEIPRVGKMSFENLVANPRSSDLTIVAGLDDATPGQVYFYIGTKTNTGNTIEKAGLANGNLYSIAVNGMLTETNTNMPAPNTTFTTINLGNVAHINGTTLNTNSNNAGVTNFLRPEDGAWDPMNPNDFYFATTNSFGSPSRLWKVHFNSLDSIMNGGTITAVLDGTEGQQMLDNLTMDHNGKITLVEDVGGNAHLGKIWQYDTKTDVFTQVAVHDSTRFMNGSANFLTQDEEASGILDVQSILGPGMFLVDVQAHYAITGDLVEGGQLLAFYNPISAAAVAEVNLKGNNVNIVDGDMTPAANDNTDFGVVGVNHTAAKTFTLENAGPGALTVSNISFTGVNANEFTVSGASSFPWTIAANGSQTFTVQFLPVMPGTRTTTMHVYNSDYSETNYDVALKGDGALAEINVTGNTISIVDGDATPGTTNNTDFGNVAVGSDVSKTFDIKNVNLGDLIVSSISFNGADSNDFTLTNAPTFPMTITGNSSQTITVKFAPAATGLRSTTLNIVSNDADEANYDFVIQGMGMNPTGINTVTSSATALTIYPNPTDKIATVSMKLKNDEQVVIRVFDIQGKQVLEPVRAELKAGDQTISVNTSGLQSGNYFVQINAGGEPVKLKLVVVH